MRRAWWFTRGCLSQQLWSYKVPESRRRIKTWFYGSFNRFHICWAVVLRLTSLLSAWRKHVKLYIQYSDVTHWAPVNRFNRSKLGTFEIFEECGLMWLVTFWDLWQRLSPHSGPQWRSQGARSSVCSVHREIGANLCQFAELQNSIQNSIE